LIHLHGLKNEVSNSDQLLCQPWAIIIPEAGTSALSFRSPELSQPSEVLSSYSSAIEFDNPKGTIS
jgi:hypothetical protein